MQKQNSFTEHTNAFRIKAFLLDCNLTIQLFDFVNWAYYERTYTQQDIGKQIHRKLDLQDIIQSLQQSNQSDEQRMLQKQNIKHYKFGTVIRNGEVPSYKIQQQGRITIYNTIVQRKNNNKEVTYESKLELKKIRNMTGEQIAQEKQMLQNINQEKLINRIYGKYEQLKEENKYLIEQLKNTKVELNEVKFQLKQMKLKLDLTNKQVKSAIQLINTDRIFMKQQFQKSQRQIQKLNEQIRNYQTFQIATDKKVPSKEMSLNLMRGLDQANINKFKIVNNQVINEGDNGNWTQFIFNQVVPNDKAYTFKIKIVKSPKQGIFIGIVDYQKQKNKVNSQGSGNSVCYYSYGNSGQTFYPQRNQGIGYKQGQTVEVRVNLPAKKVSWYVEGSLRAQVISDILQDKSIVFMPFIQMSYVGDIMEWVY